MTSADSSTSAAPSSLAARLCAAADAIEHLPLETPPVLRLAQAWNGFYLARAISVLLSAKATPHRDAYDLAERWGTQALELLEPVIGAQLARKYTPGGDRSAAGVAELARNGQLELYTAADADIEKITGEMIRVAAALQRLLEAVGDDDAAPPVQQSVARAVAPLAREVWAHYGGDGGGW